MAREWIDYAKGELDTKFGMMEFALTEANHVHLSAGSGSDRYPGLDINRVLYTVSAHLFWHPDGIWRVKEPYREPYMSRKGSFGDPSPSARKKAGEALSDAWTAFISNPAGHVERLNSELAHVNNAIGSIDEDYEKAMAVVRDVEGKRKSLLDHEEDVRAELRAIPVVRRKHWDP